MWTFRDSTSDRRGRNYTGATAVTEPQRGNWPDEHAGGWRGAAAMTASAVLLTLLMSAPVLRDPAQRLFGSDIAGRHHDPYTVITQFERPPAPGPYTQPLTDYAGVALARVTGGVVAYNAIVLVSFPLAALCAFLLVRRLTGDAVAAAVAGFVFAFSAFHLAHAAYHPHVAQVQWLPLYFLALWMALERFTTWRAGGLLAAAALAAGTNFYGGLIAAVLTPPAALTFWLTRRRRDARLADRSLFRVVVLLAFAGLAGLGYVAAAAPSVLDPAARPAFPAQDLARYGAAWWAYLLPPVDHPVAGAWAARTLGRAGIHEGIVEQQLSIPWSVLVLAGIAITAAWRARGAGPRLHSVPAWVVIGTAAFFFSLAPGQTLFAVPLLSPASALHDVLPMFRSVARFGVVVGLAAASLAGIGAAHLLASRARAARAGAVALLAMTVLEMPLVPPWRWHPVLPTEGHRWLTQVPPASRILELGRHTPADRALPALLRRDLTFLDPNIADVAAPDLAQALAAQGYTHALYRRPSAAGQWLEAHPAGGLRRLQDFPDSVVLAVDPPAPRISTRFESGFYERERGAAGSWRWMHHDGRWSAISHEPRAVTAGLDIEMESLAVPREVEVRLDGVPAATLLVTPSRRRYRLDGLTLSPGVNTLMFHSRTPAARADVVLRNGDPRELSVAIWNWTWTMPRESSRP